MRYVKAAAVGLVVAITGGAIAGFREYFMLAGGPDAGARARVYAESIAVALNCAALFALLCVPVAVVAQVVRSRRSAR
jgi:hypothetical protein